MPWQQLPTTFDKAQKKEAYRRFARTVAGRRRERMLSLDEVKQKIRPFEQTYVGIRPIPVGKIIGSASRTEDFDKDFLPLRPEARERWLRLEKAFEQIGFPPIVVYQLGDSYFVVDGHHRVAIAKWRRMEFIDAEITELRTNFELPEDLDLGRIIYGAQRHMFMDESGLDRARPEASIEFSRPHSYAELLELVKIHGFHLMIERGEVLPMEVVAGDWYDRVYLPTVESIRHERLAEVFSDKTEADLFLYIWERRRALFPERGGLSLEDVVRSVSEEHERRLRARARSTLRRIARQPSV